MVAKTLTPLEDIYTAICSAVKAQKDYVEPINRYVRGRHELANLAILHASRTIDEDTKRATYKAIVEALKARDMSTLKVEPAGRVDLSNLLKPAARVVAVEPVAEASRMNGTLELVDTPPPARVVVPEVDEDATLPPEDEDEEEPQGNKLEQFQRLLSEIVQPKNSPIDAGAVDKIVSKHIESVNKRLTSELDAMHERLAELVKNGGGSKLEVTINSATHTVEGITHYQLPQVVTWVGANVPLWLWGKAGGGKTHLFYQVAAALGLKPYVVSIDPTTTINKLLGYRNLATGEFVEGLIYQPFKTGGLFAPDELDTGDPGVIAGLNALLANGHFMFPNGELVERHKDFRVLVGANTKGTGAVAGYTARQRLDAATLDRFAVIEFGYDEGMEMALCVGGKPTTPRWEPIEPADEKFCRQYVEWVQRIRKAAGESVLVSPRASYNGVKALRAGIRTSEVAEALVFKLVTPDTKARLINQAGPVPEL